jgi:phosphatidylserine decarboxylase
VKGRRNPYVAREGIPLLVATIIGGGLAWKLESFFWTLSAAALFVYLFFVFRDPRRASPAAPLGVFSPVDGVVADITVCKNDVGDGLANKVILRIDSLGTYTARCPVEGRIMDFSEAFGRNPAAPPARGLWVRTDEDDDVVLQFHGYRFGLAPRAFLRFGERVGQGQRCAYLRLTRFAEVQLPINGRVLVSVGQRVSAGSDLLAKLPKP